MKTIITLIALALCAGAYCAEPIPDLTAQQVKSAFSTLGFEPEKPLYTREQTEQRMRGEVEGNLFDLQLFGPPFESTELNVISAMVQNYVLAEDKTNELSLSFLCLAASMPYTGCTPAEARIWIAANIGKNTEKMFGPVKLQLSASGRTRMLRMSTDALAPKIPEGTGPAITHLDPSSRIKSTKIPDLGTLFADVELEHGKPVIRDPDTGWATWPLFKVQFKDGKVADVQRRTPAP